MKKGFKVLIIMAVICASLGIALAGIGVSLGGWRNFLKWAEEGEFSFGIGLPKMSVGEIEFNDRYEVYTGEGNKIAVAANEEIQKIDLAVDGASVEVKKSDTDELRIAYESVRKLQFYVENGTLYIRQKNDAFIMSKTIELTIYIPERLQLAKVELELGGGKIVVDYMKADNFDVELGAGELVIKELYADRTSLMVGAGAIDVKKGEVGGMSIEVGMGSFDYTGSIHGDISVECAMGSASFDLSGERMDYNYDIECAMGSVKVGDKEYNGIIDTSIGNDAKWDCDLECAMGSISIRFR